MKPNRQKIISVLLGIKPYFFSKGIDKIALFGSYSKAEETLYSDIDIAIKKRADFLQHHSAYDYFETINELKTVLRKKLSRNIDIFDMDSNSTFKETIESEIIYA